MSSEIDASFVPGFMSMNEFHYQNNTNGMELVIKFNIYFEASGIWVEAV